MLSLHIPEISPIVGDNNDGIVIGSVDQSSLAAVFRNTKHSRSNLVYRRASNGTITNLSTAAASDVSNFNPFGADGAMAANDMLFLAAEGPINEIYFNIVTSSDWVGTGFTLWDSFDGLTPNRQLAIISDETDGLRATAGVHRIVFTRPSIEGLSFSPDISAMPSKSWLVLKLNGFSSSATAPVCARLWFGVDDNVSLYDDLSTEISAAMDNATFSRATESILPIIGSHKLTVFPNISFGLDFVVFRQTTDDAEVSHLYYAEDKTWKPLVNLIDGSDDMKNGPSSLGPTGTAYTARWSLPADWTQNELTIPTVSGSRKISGFFLKEIVTSVTLAVQLTPLYRARCRSLGDAYSRGLYHHARSNYAIATFDIGVPSQSDTVIQIINVDTAKEATITIPANCVSSKDLPLSYVPLSHALDFAPSESLMISCISGTLIQDVKLILQ